MLHLNENEQPIHMRYHLFLHHGWLLQNLGKDFVRTNMHTTVPSNKYSEPIFPLLQIYVLIVRQQDYTLYNLILCIARNLLETKENIKIESHPFYQIICDWSIFMGTKQNYFLFFEKKNQNGRLKKTEFFKIAHSQKIDPWVNMIDWCKGYGLEAVRGKVKNSQNSKKCIFCVFRLFLHLRRRASRPYRLGYINALCINQSN